MDAMTSPGVQRITIMTSAQVGKTELLLNLCGYVIDYDPCSMLVIQPTIEMAMTWSKDRFSPMVRDVAALKDRVSEVRARDSENTLLHKLFKGGHISIAGANSASSLAGRPVRIVLMDEVDRYPISAGTEGDPFALAKVRTKNFFNRKIIATSTPTIAGASRIESLFNESLRHYYYVPCTKCGTYQILRWEQIKWDKDIDGLPIIRSAGYECVGCNQRLFEQDKVRMVQAGGWRAVTDGLGGGNSTLTETSGGVREGNGRSRGLHVGADKDRPLQTTSRHVGFHISELYSPWSDWQKVVEDFYEAKKKRETLRVWTNTTLGEVFEEEEGYKIADSVLYERREKYKLLPDGVIFLTCGVDVQDDRIIALVRGWGVDDESWFVGFTTFHGSPGAGKVWAELDKYLDKSWEHEGGYSLRIVATGIDTGGHFSQSVYKYIKPRQSKRVYAFRGSGGMGRPLVGKPTQNNDQKVYLYTLGVDTGKELIYSHLQIEEPGPGYVHFNEDCDEDYFRQLTAEKQVPKFKLGFPTKVWVRIREKNHALDCEVYALAARDLLNPNYEKIKENTKKRVAPQEKPQEGVEVQQTRQPRPIARGRSNYATSWRR